MKKKIIGKFKAIDLKTKKGIVRFLYKLGLYGFAVCGMCVLGAWGVYQMGFTNNSGAIDKNNRYLADVSEMSKLAGKSKEAIDAERAFNYYKIMVISKFFPENAKLIAEGLRNSEDDKMVSQMIAACELYLKDNEEYARLIAQGEKMYKSISVTSERTNAIEWMNLPEWAALKQAIIKDKHLIDSAAAVTGVEPRLIVGCLVGEQIRLFNSKREMYKKYLGPVKVLSVQSQFSLGVNGIKDFTAIKVESNLKNDTSVYYMGKRFENILNFRTSDPTTERVNRLVDYSNHFYSYVYTGCILHQTKKQWERAKYDISNRPEILFTLFNVGFPQSNPGPNPQCGGSHINVGDKVYTFGAIGFDFYYSGELADEFPYQAQKFKG